jgi:hypothetical protein
MRIREESNITIKEIRGGIKKKFPDSNENENTT